MINKFKIGDSVVVVDYGEAFEHASPSFGKLGFSNLEFNESLDNGTIADVFEIELNESLDEWMYAIRDADGNECLIGESGLAYNVDVSPLNSVGKEVYIIVNNSITRERISKVVLSREENEDGELTPLEENYYFAKLDVWRSADGVYFNKEDLIKGL